MAKERKWASECQIEGVEIVEGLQQKIKLAKEQHDVLKKCGLDREAKAILPKIQEIEAQKLRLMEEIDRNRKKRIAKIRINELLQDYENGK